ncbi:MAG: LytTR family transcriptional regulator [Gammaproteobacteria bacterium]|nr:LytTR family transcriptional regulator [Gammaproteobacteria bacterium]
MTLQSYIANRRFWEFGLFVLLILISLGANLGVQWIDFMRSGTAFDGSVPIVLEVTSHIAMALSLPLILWFDSLLPIRLLTWKNSLLAHLGFSVAFSFSHVFLMYWMRVAVFPAVNGSHYHWANWLGDFGYEYLKDFRTYLIVVALIYLYRFVLRRLQGEAGFLSEQDGELQTRGVSDRFLVKKLGKEFLVRIDEIDWIESCGNYVNLHVGSRTYPLRETMTRIDQRLVPMGFQRVHRSAIVNLDRVAEIVAFDSGDGQAKLRSDATIPVSRRFKQELRDRLT